MDSAIETETQGEGAPNPSNGNEEEKAKVVVIMGPTGSGKSRLAIDLATHFPIEIINADSMQVYHGLDVLTNKVSLNDQKGLSLFSHSLSFFITLCVCVCLKGNYEFFTLQL